MSQASKKKRPRVTDPNAAEATFGLALSGGGFRASLFAVGSLIRIHEQGLFPRLKRVTAVSGGSITLGVAAMNWEELAAAPPGCRATLDRLLIQPIVSVTSQRLDVPNVIKGMLWPSVSAADLLARGYRRHLFGDHTLSQLPKSHRSSANKVPEFVFYATNLQTGRSVRLTGSHISDYTIGRYRLNAGHDVALATAVAASSAFPPFFAPVVLRGLDASRWRTTKRTVHTDPAFRHTLHLGDGGIYDNLGLEAHWQSPPDFLLVADSGRPFATQPHPRSNWASTLMRTIDIMADQQRSLRTRVLLDEFQRPTPRYGGTFWSIATRMDQFEDPETPDFRALLPDNAITAAMAQVPTVLRPIPADTKHQLMNWGYALADTALRRYVFMDSFAGRLPFSGVCYEPALNRRVRPCFAPGLQTSQTRGRRAHTTNRAEVRPHSIAKRPRPAQAPARSQGS